jgi:hypothetical protein
VRIFPTPTITCYNLPVTSPTSNSGPDAARLQQPLARMLRPLVRLLLRCGVTFPALSDLLRELYVQVAETDFALDSKAQTDSRISLLTGIHRKEVRRLREAGTKVSAMPAALSRASRIVAVWLSTEPFVGPDGAPLRLPRSAPRGAPSFEALVASVTRDVRPRAVLDEFVASGLVDIDDEGAVALRENGVVPSTGSDEQLYYFGRNLHDHIAAAAFNVSGGEPRFLERAVHYDGLSAKLAARLAESSRDLAMQALRSANQLAQEGLAAGETGAYRWTFGTFVFREAERPDEAGQATGEDPGA